MFNASSNRPLTEPWIEKNWKLEDWNWQNWKLDDWNEKMWKLEGQFCIFAYIQLLVVFFFFRIQLLGYMEVSYVKMCVKMCHL